MDYLEGTRLEIIANQMVQYNVGPKELQREVIKKSKEINRQLEEHEVYNGDIEDYEAMKRYRSHESVPSARKCFLQIRKADLDYDDDTKSEFTEKQLAKKTLPLMSGMITMTVNKCKMERVSYYTSKNKTNSILL